MSAAIRVVILGPGVAMSGSWWQQATPALDWSHRVGCDYLRPDYSYADAQSIDATDSIPVGGIEALPCDGGGTIYGCWRMGRP